MIDVSVRFPRSIHIITALSVLAALIGIPALVFSGAGW